MSNGDRPVPSTADDGLGGIHLGKISLVLCIALLSAAAVYISVLIFQRQATLDRVSRYNVAWSVSQAVAELGRLEHRVAAFALPKRMVGADEVMLRYEILLSRLANLKEGEVASFARDRPELVAITRDLQRALEDIAPLVGRLTEPGAVETVLNRLEPLDAKLVQFAGAANRFGGEQVSRDQHELIDLHTTFSTMTGGLIVSGIILLSLVFTHNRLLRTAHKKMHAMAANLSSTSVSKEYLDDIVDSMSEGLLVTSLTGSIEKINAAAARLTGFGAQELLSMPLARLMPGIGTILSERGSIAAADMRAVDALAMSNGEWLPVRVSSALMPDSLSGRQRLVCVFQSLADQKRAEVEQSLLREQLYQAHKMQAIGTLAGGIAHDFNNILGTILGHGYLALEDIDETHPARESLEHIMVASDRAKSLVQQILTYSRNAVAKIEPIDAGEAIEGSLAVVRSGIPSNVALTVDCLDHVAIKGDVTQLHQVMLNLCGNAAHAIGDAPGKICVRVERIDVDPAALNQLHAEGETDDTSAASPASAFGARAFMWFGTLSLGSYCRVSVDDTGCGIDRSTMSRIFEPFFTTKEVGKGTGLGLAAVHGILRNHSAVASVESVVGRGTKFSIYFPVTIDAVSDVVDLPVATTAETGRERILLVDDDQSLLNMSRQTLTRLGYNVVAFSQPEEALKSFSVMPGTWDLVLTDRSMPRMSGEDLARRILTIRPDIPVVMVTGYGESDDEHRIRQIGVAEFLHKPLVGTELASVLRRALDRAAAA